LGVATLVATQALSETMSKATLAAGNPMAGTIDLIITNGDSPIDRDLTKALKMVKGVKEVHAKIFDQVKLVIGDKKIPVMVMGFDLTGDAPRSDGFEEQFKLSETMEVVKVSYGTLMFARQMPAIIGKELDKDLNHEKLSSLLGYRVLHLEKNLKKHAVVSIAWVEPKEQGDWAAFGGYVVILDLDNAATVVGMPKGKARRIDIALERGADPNKVRNDLGKVLQGQAEVRTMEEQNQSLQSAMVGMKAGFSMCGVAALIVGMFLVYTCLAFSVAERRHEIGILRSLGATRDQVWRLFAGEAFVLGALGAALGIPVGMGLAYLGLRPMQDAIGDLFASMNLRQIELSWELTALAFSVGILSALIASLVPALHAP